MAYQFIHKKSYWFYSPVEVIKQLYYFAEIRRDLGTKIKISKSELRRIVRYNKVSKNLLRILYYYYNHKVKKLPKLNGSKGVTMRPFGNVGVNSSFESKSWNDLNRLEQIELALDSLKLTGNKANPETARFITLNTSYGLFWVSLKKKGYNRLIMHHFKEVHLEQIKKEIEHLISSQILLRETRIKER